MSYILSYNGKDYTNLLEVNSCQSIFSFYNTADVTLTADISLLSTFKKGNECKLILLNGNNKENIVNGIITELYIDSTAKCRLIIKNKSFLLTKITPTESFSWGDATTKTILEAISTKIGLKVSGLPGLVHKNASAFVDEMCDDVAEYYVKNSGAFAYSIEDGSLLLASPSGNKTSKVYSKVNTLYCLKHENMYAGELHGYIGATLTDTAKNSSFGSSNHIENYQILGNPSIQETNAFLRNAAFSYDSSDYLQLHLGNLDDSKLLDIVSVKDILGITKSMLVAKIQHKLDKNRAIKIINLVNKYV